MPSDPSENSLPLTHEILTDGTIALKLVGVGGAGANAVDRLKMENLDRLQLAVINTDHQALSSSPVQDKVLIGSRVTYGLSAGGDPETGREAAEADREKIAAVVRGCDLVFLLAGLGGGTGGGAGPVVAEVASTEGALVIAFVTMPFAFERGRRLKQAEEALVNLRKTCDAVIPLPNDLLFQESAADSGLLDSLARADEWIGRGVKSIWAMLFRTGLINLDFATVRQVFRTRGGKTLFGLGYGEGENAAADAVADLKLCPLLHTSELTRKADRLLVNIVGGPDLSLARVNELMTAVTETFGPESHVVMGAVVDEAMQGKIEICVLGTSDISTRGILPRRPVAAPRGKSSAPPSRPAVALVPASASLAGEPAPVSAAAVAEARAGADPAQQNEFTFGEVENRGSFDRTDRTMFEGQDLDVPTYQRKGVKLAL
jgi:cell division protein FtsZ